VPGTLHSGGTQLQHVEPNPKPTHKMRTAEEKLTIQILTHLLSNLRFMHLTPASSLRVTNYELPTRHEDLASSQT
jgi:hypothetical protein